MAFLDDDRAPHAAAPRESAVPGPATKESATHESATHGSGVLSLSQRVAVLRAQVDALTKVKPRDLGSTDALGLFDDLFELGDRITALAVQVLPVIENDGLWAVKGARTFPTWLARRARITHARASRLTRLGRALRDELPATAAALVTAGPDRVSVEMAEILTTVAATSDARRTVLADPDAPCNEQFLLAQARLVSPDQLRTLTRRWAVAADPTTDERGYRDATDREFFDIAQTTGGAHLSGWLTTEHGQSLLVALTALAGVPAKDDPRTTSQRRAGALADLARLTLDHDLTGPGGAARPHLSVLVDYPTLVNLILTTGTGTSTTGSSCPTGIFPLLSTPPAAALNPGALNPAVFDDGQPLPRAVLDRMLCDADITRIVFGPDSQLLDVGRTYRTYPAHLRRAIIARDKHCQYPGCHAPPRLCQCHHCQHWTRDHGRTDARTGILLCYHHHTVVHDLGIEIHWRPATGWQFTDRTGQPLNPD